MKNRIFRVLQVLAAPFKLLLLAVPAVALMVYTNYSVDCSGLFQGDLSNRTVVELLLDGQNVSCLSQMDQRAVAELYLQLQPAESVPETAVLGSSRVMQLGSWLQGTTVYNYGVTGGSYRDTMNLFYLLDQYEKLPQRVLLGIDPWLFRADALDKRTNNDLYEEMLAVALGQDTGYVPAEPGRFYRLCDSLVQRATRNERSLASLHITDTTLPALFEPAYFQGNVQYYSRASGGRAVTEDGEEIPFRAVSRAEMLANEDEIKCADGSIWYSWSFRNPTPDESALAVWEQTVTFLYMSDYAALETDQCRLFEQFVRYMQSRGVEVVFFLAPYHPTLYEYVSTHDVEAHAGFFEIEPYVRAFAARSGIQVVGSYDPNLLGLTGEDFFDGLHVRESGIQKFFSGFDADGAALPGTEYDGVALCPLESEEEADPDAGPDDDA